MPIDHDYLGGLTCPDLRPYFKHLHWRPMQHAFGRMVASDWADKSDDDPVFGLYKRCGLWTREEAAILQNAILDRRGLWVDIGAHTGWTTAHIIEGQAEVIAVEPMLRTPGFKRRLEENLEHYWSMVHECTYQTSERFFHGLGIDAFSGFCIDGDHEPGAPLFDAQNAAKHLAETGAIIFHDFIGKPVREAVTWLMNNGFHGRVYYTPHMVALCWRGDFRPPDHVPDPDLMTCLAPHLAQMTDFDFTRCE